MEEEVYTIGEVSKILNISRDMIRYYEKRGVLQSKRDEKSNYRRYTTMDVFWLFEAMEYNSWGIEIGDISKVRNEDFNERTAGALEDRIDKIQKDLNYQRIYLERLKSLKDRFRFCLMNIGNYWIRRIPAHYICHLTNGRGDVYERIEMTPEIRSFFSDSKIPPFIDSGYLFQRDVQEWIWSVDESFVKQLQVNVPEGFRYVPEMTCLCTNVDIGEIGSFKKHADEPVRQYARQRHYHVSGDLQALLVARGTENDRFRRIVEFHLPIDET